ncbi:MAG: DEAD/DEAH box helicase family protein, partial [Microcystaceae cyanobacterium]
MIVLRDYQQSLIQGIYEQWTQYQRVMAQLPTGGGKTVIFAAIANEFIAREERVLVLAHREELITQAGYKLEAVTGSPVGIIKAGYQPNPLLPVQVASVQSMVRRLKQFEDFSLIVIDEAHHTTAKTYRKILEAYPN